MNERATRWLTAVAAVAALGACGSSPEEYCDAKQDAHERAYGSADQRAIWMEGCTEGMARRQRESPREYECRVECVDEHLSSSYANAESAQEALLSLGRCERACVGAVEAERAR